MNLRVSSLSALTAFAIVLSAAVVQDTPQRATPTSVIRSNEESWGTVLSTRSTFLQQVAFVRRDVGDVVLVIQDVDHPPLQQGERVNTNHFRPFTGAQQRLERTVSI